MEKTHLARHRRIHNSQLLLPFGFEDGVQAGIVKVRRNELLDAREFLMRAPFRRRSKFYTHEN